MTVMRGDIPDLEVRAQEKDTEIDPFLEVEAGTTGEEREVILDIETIDHREGGNQRTVKKMFGK